MGLLLHDHADTARAGEGDGMIFADWTRCTVAYDDAARSDMHAARSSVRMPRGRARREDGEDRRARRD